MKSIRTQFAAAVLAGVTLLSGCSKAEQHLQDPDPLPGDVAAKVAKKQMNCVAAKENGKDVSFCKSPDGTVKIIPVKP